jgi:uncharacterized protein
MRLDELPTSDRVEDRRGLPGGRAGLGIGTVVILGLLAWTLGIDPRVLRSNDLPKRMVPRSSP